MTSRRIAGAAACLLVAAMYARLYFGVDIVKEAFFVDVAYRYSLGARPFVDEVTFAQLGAGVVLAPFVWVYRHVVGLTGVVLFTRHVWFALTVSAAAAVFAGARRLLDRTVAFALSVLFVAFIPGVVPNVNYDALGSTFFGAGCVVAMTSHRWPRAPWVAGLLLGGAVLAYPTLVPAVAALAVAWWVVERPSRRDVSAFAAALAVGCIVLVAIALWGGVDAIHDALHVRSATGNRTGAADRVVRNIRDGGAFFVLAPLAIAAIAGALRFLPRRATLLAFATVAAAFPTSRWGATSTASHFVENLGLLAAVAIAVSWPSPEARRALAVFVPSCIAAVTFAFTTTNRGGHVGLGLLGAAFVTLVFLVRAAGERSAAAPFIPVLAAAVLVAHAFTVANRDAPTHSLRALVHSGPYAGLVTTPARRAYVTAATRTIAGAANGRCTLLAFYDLPAAYLLTAAAPRTDSVWLPGTPAPERSYAAAEVAYLRAHGLPDVIVRTSAVPFGGHGTIAEGSVRGDPLVTLAEHAPYRRVATGPWLAVYRRAGASC